MRSNQRTVFAGCALLVGWALATLACLSGCGSDSAASPPPIVEQQDASSEDVTVKDAPVEKDAANEQASDAAQGGKWVPEPAPASGPAVYLGEAAIQNGKLRIPIQGKGLDTLYGIAYRVEFDATALKFESMTKGEAWSAVTPIDKAKEARAGLLVGVVTHQGKADGIKVADGALAYLEFTVLHPAAAKVQFVAGRCAIVQPDGAELPKVAWSGGALSIP